MSEGCPGCWQSMRGQQELLSQVRLKAKDHAIQIQKAVAIYREGFEYFFIEYGTAIERKYPIAEVVSHLQRMPNVGV